MYETLVLVDQDSRISADDLERQLRVFCDDRGAHRLQLIRKGEGFSIKWPGFALVVNRNTRPTALAESVDIAARFAAGRPEQEKIALCSVRIEISGDNDPGMDYSNDFCLILEAIEELGIVYTFDSGSGQFMNL